jgi:hypothetical protein
MIYQPANKALETHPKCGEVNVTAYRCTNPIENWNFISFIGKIGEKVLPWKYFYKAYNHLM